MALVQRGFDLVDENSIPSAPQGPGPTASPPAGYDKREFAKLAPALEKVAIKTFNEIERYALNVFHKNNGAHNTRFSLQQEADAAYALWSLENEKVESGHPQYQTHDAKEYLATLKANSDDAAKRLADFDANRERPGAFLKPGDVANAVIKAGRQYSAFVAIDPKSLDFDVPNLPKQKKGQSLTEFLAVIRQDDADTAKKEKETEARPRSQREASKRFLTGLAAFIENGGDSVREAYNPIGGGLEYSTGLCLKLLKNEILMAGEKAIEEAGRRFGSRCISDADRSELRASLRARRDALEILDCHVVRAIRAAGGEAYFKPILRNPLNALGIRPDTSKPRPSKPNANVLPDVYRPTTNDNPHVRRRRA